MATRTYAGTLPINPEQMGALIDTALSRTGDLVTLLEVSGSPLVISVTHPSLTSADDATINGVIAAYVFDPNFRTTSEIATNRAGAIALAQGLHPTGEILRAVAAVLLDEVNIVREWTVSFKAATAAATSLANLQTRVAALPDLPDRTLTQAKTAIAAKINAGTVDT